jgi:hypothetical protein
MGGFLVTRLQDNQVMLRVGSIFVLLTTIIFSCNKRNQININSDLVKEYQKINFYKYKTIYKACTDSLNYWAKDTLKVAQTIFYYGHQLDSSFCFNTDSSRFFTTINYSSANFKNAQADDIQEFGGAKINNKWYFFFLATMVVPREYYKDDIYEPLTFAELSALSHQEIMHRYIIKNKDGTYSPNDAAFKRTFFYNWSCGDRLCEDNAEIDSIILLNSRAKYQHKLDKKEIVQIKEEMANSKRPEAAKKWWKFW